MRNITLFNNRATIVHVPALPSMKGGALAFGFAPGKLNETPTVRINIKSFGYLLNDEQIHLATYEATYKIEGEGFVIEDNIYSCCNHATDAMRKFLEFHEIGRSIPDSYTLCPGKEAFGDDLIDVAKVLNAAEGKRGFPPPKP